MAEAKNKVVASAKTKDEPSKKLSKDAKTEVVNNESVALEVELTTSDSTLDTKAAKAGNTSKSSVQPAKAGRRSEKAIKEAEEKQAKEERKAANKDDVAAEKPKVTQNPARSKLERRSKAYRKSAELIEKDKSYELPNAIELGLKTSSVKFDASLELHINLGVDPRQADQNIRQTVVLPAGTGKSVRVAVLAEADDIEKAKKAGADIAAGDELLQQIEKGEIMFDVLISTPNMMAKLGKFARVLGPQGLMPNPKSGTVTTNVEKAVTESKAGKIEYRVDTNGTIHVACGKISFGQAKLESNCKAILSSIKAAKPASLKGNYIKSIYLTTTMGPSILVNSSNDSL